MFLLLYITQWGRITIPPPLSDIILWKSRILWKIGYLLSLIIPKYDVDDAHGVGDIHFAVAV